VNLCERKEALSERSRNAADAGNEKRSRPHNGHPVRIQESRTEESVLILSDDADFARIVVGRWQTERTVPAFTLMGSDLFTNAITLAHNVTILGPRVNHLAAVLKSLESIGDAVICVVPESGSVPVRDLGTKALVVRQNDGWVDGVIQLSAEILRRSHAMRKLQQAEQNLAANHRHATLGRYMLEMRHSLNNCLTSVLGNAELLLMEPGRLTADTREQIETIHTMALRMHEVLQRFSSLESEMQFAEKESHSETAVRSHIPSTSQ